MLEQAVRHAILELHRRGQGVRAIARALAGLPGRGARRPAARLGRGAAAGAPGEGARPPRRHPAAPPAVRGQFHARARGADQGRAPALLSGPDRLLPPPRDRPGAQAAGRPLRLRARARRCSTTPRRTTCTSAARSGACRPPASCSPTRGCSSSSSTRGSAASSARCSSPRPCATWTGPARPA